MSSVLLLIWVVLPRLALRDNSRLLMGSTMDLQ
jgi:hypothetical protein